MRLGHLVPDPRGKLVQVPLAARAAIGRSWPLSQRRKAEPVGSALSVELLSMTEMRHLLPRSEIWYERVAGLVKSIVTIR